MKAWCCPQEPSGWLEHQARYTIITASRNKVAREGQIKVTGAETAGCCFWLREEGRTEGRDIRIKSLV